MSNSRRIAIIAVVIAACDDGGTAAPDGAPDTPLVPLTRTEDIPTGPECPASGTRVLVGLDDDADGTLDDAEVDSATVICRDLVRHEGDLVVRNDADARALQGVNVVTGSLIVESDALVDVDLSALVEIGGDLRCGFGGVATVPLLRSVGGDLALSVVAFDLPRLESVGGSASLRTNGNGSLRACHPITVPALRTVGGNLTIVCFPGWGMAYPGHPYELPALTMVGGGIEVSGQFAFHAPAVTRLAFLTIDPAWNANENGENKVRSVTLEQLETIEGTLLVLRTDLDELSLPRLRQAQRVEIQRIDDRLPVLSLPALESASVVIRDARMLTSVSVPVLREAPEIHVESNPRLIGLAMPALTSATTLTIDRHQALASLDLPMLTSLTTIRVTSNPMLPTCQAEAIADRTAATRTISGNGDGACAP